MPRGMGGAMISPPSLVSVETLAALRSDTDGRLQAAIITARREGATLKEIADAAGVTPQRIQQITGPKEKKP